jgi:hypothetical protein
MSAIRLLRVVRHTSHYKLFESAYSRGERIYKAGA